MSLLPSGPALRQSWRLRAAGVCPSLRSGPGWESLGVPATQLVLPQGCARVLPGRAFLFVLLRSGAASAARAASRGHPSLGLRISPLPHGRLSPVSSSALSHCISRRSPLLECYPQEGGGFCLGCSLLSPCFPEQRLAQGRY